MTGMSTGFAAAPAYVNAMMALGILMAAGIFRYIYFGPWQQLARAAQAEDWSAAESAIAKLRSMVRINLTLGLITALAGAGGRYLL